MEAETIWCTVHEMTHPEARLPTGIDAEGLATGQCSEEDWTGAMVVKFPRTSTAEKRIVRVLVYEGTADWVNDSTEEQERGGAFVTGSRNPFETRNGSITEVAKAVLP